MYSSFCSVTFGAKPPLATIDSYLQRCAGVAGSIYGDCAAGGPRTAWARPLEVDHVVVVGNPGDLLYLFSPRDDRLDLGIVEERPSPGLVPVPVGDPGLVLR